MGASIYGNVGGVSHKGKELYVKVNGVNRKIKKEYAKVNGVVRKVYSGYQCQGKNLDYGTISENGAISLDLTNNPNQGSLFYLHFDEPIAVKSGAPDALIEIKQLTTTRIDIALIFYVYDRLTSGTLIASGSISTYHDNPVDVFIWTRTTGNFQDFYFKVESNGVKGTVPRGGLHINGEQINNVELI